MARNPHTRSRLGAVTAIASAALGLPAGALAVVDAPGGYFTQVIGSRVSPVASGAPAADSRSFTGADNNAQAVQAVVRSPATTTTVNPVRTANDQAFLQGAIDDAIAATERRVVFPPNQTYQLAAPLNIKPATGGTSPAASDIELDFGNSTLVFSTIAYQGDPRGGGLWINGAQRVRVKNVTIRYAKSTTRPIWSLGTVVPDTPTTAHIDLANTPPPSGLPVQAVTAYGGAASPWMWDQAKDYRAVHFIGNPIPVDGTGNSAPRGDLNILRNKSVLVRHTYYGDNAVNVYDSQDVTLDGVRAERIPGVAFSFAFGRGHRLINSSVARATGDEIAGTADAVHVRATGGDIIIENGNFGYQGDDGINIHGDVRNVTRASQTTINAQLTDDEIFERTKPGDTVLFYTAPDMRYLGSAVVSQVGLGSPHTMTFSGTSPVPTGTARILVSQQIPRRVYVAGNAFHDNLGRGALFLGASALWQNNTIEKMQGAAFLGLVDDSQFGEGPGVVNTILRGNSFTNVTGGPAVTPAAEASFGLPGVVHLGHALGAADPNHHLHDSIKVENSRIRRVLSATPPIFTSSAAKLGTPSRSGNLGMISRTFNSTTNQHDVSYPGYVGSGTIEGDTAWAFLESGVAGTLAANECAYADGIRHLVSTVVTPLCEGLLFVGQIGHLYGSAITGAGPRVYRCFVPSTNDHFISTSSICENTAVTVDGPLGYAAAP